MIKKLLVYTFVIAGGFLFFNTVQAQQNPFNIQFPVAELGNCGSYDACKTYCDDPANSDACLTFAENNGLISKKEAKVAREVGIQGGPGGCKSEAECRNYCESGEGEHFDECIAFAEKNSLMSKEELAMAKKVGRQGGPGGCRSKEACDAFCQQDANFETCLKFAEENNLIPPEELARAKQLGNKPGPGGCRGPACKTYCDDTNHFDECLKFGEDNGFINAKEAEMARKIGNKPGPGGCRGEQCRTYCEDSSHREECFKFAKENNLIPPEELERAEKFQNLEGPGGCRGDTCRTYCEDPTHNEECFKFAKENNLMLPEEIQKMERMQNVGQNFEKFGGPGGCKGEDECNNFCNDPNNTQTCISFAKDAGLMRPEEARQNLRQFQQNIQGIPGFAPMRPPAGQMGPPPAFQSGPGGCSSPEECIKFCSSPENRSTCAQSGPPAGGPPPGGTFRQAPPPGQGGAGQGNERQEFEGQRPPEGVRPPEGFQVPEGSQPPAGFQQPQGNFTPPPGEFIPPPAGFTPPPSGEFQFAPPPAPTEPAPAPVPPQTLLPYSPFGVILNFFLGR